MNWMVEVGMLAVFALVLVPVSVFLVQVISAVSPRSPASLVAVRRPRVAILVPAHNESSGIRTTLDSLLPQLGDGDRILVVADNCSDDTASQATDAGVEVVERHDSRLRGKGYALDFGVHHLTADPPEVVVIVDADCEVETGAIDRIARLCAISGRPIQALYLMKTQKTPRPSMAIAEFAWLVRNKVRPLGFRHLGLPCQLMGSGMAVEWAVLRSVQLASGHLAEDMQMGVDMARAGRPPLFCPDALVSSFFPSNLEGTRSQRARWEHGHLSMITGQVPGMLLAGFLGRGSGLIPLALDICVPPLALLSLIIAVLVAASASCAVLTSVTWPLGAAIVVLLMFAAAVGLSWWRFGRDVVSFRNLILAFSYAARKFPLYARFLFRRQVEWVRSRRDGE